MYSTVLYSTVLYSTALENIRVREIPDVKDLQNCSNPIGNQIRQLPTPISETLPLRWRLESPRKIRRSPGPLLRYSVLPSDDDFVQQAKDLMRFG